MMEGEEMMKRRRSETRERTKRTPLSVPLYS
jgi:hypothetical protein